MIVLLVYGTITVACSAALGALCGRSKRLAAVATIMSPVVSWVGGGVLLVAWGVTTGAGIQASIALLAFLTPGFFYCNSALAIIVCGFVSLLVDAYAHPE
jgi:hypothetical protein